MVRYYLCPKCNRFVKSDGFAINSDYICNECFGSLPSELQDCILNVMYDGKLRASTKDAIARKAIETGRLFDLLEVPLDYVFDKENEEYFGDIVYINGGKATRGFVAVRWH